MFINLANKLGSINVASWSPGICGSAFLSRIDLIRFNITSRLSPFSSIIRRPCLSIIISTSSSIECFPLKISNRAITVSLSLKRSDNSSTSIFISAAESPGIGKIGRPFSNISLGIGTPLAIPLIRWGRYLNGSAMMSFIPASIGIKLFDLAQLISSVIVPVVSMFKSSLNLMSATWFFSLSSR